MLPKYVFIPVRSSIPVPCLVNPPVPLIAPEYDVFALLPPTVNIPTPRETLPPKEPPPDKEPIVWLKPFRSKSTPAVFARTTVEFTGKALPTPAWSVPPLTVVVPRYVLFIPANRNVPEPCFVRPPDPLIAPAYVELALLLPRLRVPVPRAILPPIVPPPDRAPIDWLKPFKSKPAPEVFAMTTTEFDGRAFATPP